MRHGLTVSRALAVLAVGGLAPVAMAAPGDCTAYLEQAKKLNGEVQAIIGKALDDRLDVNGDRCKFRSEEWSIREEKHQAWCAGKDAAAIEQRLQKMTAEIAVCNGDLSGQRTQGGTQGTVSQPGRPGVQQPIEDAGDTTGQATDRGTGAASGTTADVARPGDGSDSAVVLREMPPGLGQPPLDDFWEALKRDGRLPGTAQAETPPSSGEPDDGRVVVTSRADDGSTVTFVVTGEDSGFQVTELEPPNPDTSIQVVSATWGANCPGVEPIDDTPDLEDDCAGYESCDHMVVTTALPDPAPRCKKIYVAEWTCGKDPTARRAAAERRPELSAEPDELFVTLRCGD